MNCATSCINMAEGGHDCFTNRHLVFPSFPKMFLSFSVLAWIKMGIICLRFNYYCNLFVYCILGFKYVVLNSTGQRPAGLHHGPVCQSVCHLLFQTSFSMKLPIQFHEISQKISYNIARCLCKLQNFCFKKNYYSQLAMLPFHAILSLSHYTHFLSDTLFLLKYHEIPVNLILYQTTKF